MAEIGETRAEERQVFAAGCTRRSTSNGLYRLVVSKGQPPRAEYFFQGEGGFFLSYASIGNAYDRLRPRKREIVRTAHSAERERERDTHTMNVCVRERERERGRR